MQQKGLSTCYNVRKRFICALLDNDICRSLISIHFIDLFHIVSFDTQIMRNYCELVLYVGRCLSDGLAPGRFYPENSDPFSLHRIAVAHGTIERYLLPVQSFGLIIDYNDLVKDNGEADKLMEYAKKHFPNATEIIEPHMCIHGRIIFARKIRFDHCDENDAGGIVKTMKMSGHVPNKLIQKAAWIRRNSGSETTVRSELRELNKKEDEIWESVFNIY